MQPMKIHRTALLLPLFLLSCTARAQPPAFAAGEVQGTVEHDEITEASGLVASRRTPGVFWTHNDSGDTTRIFALSSQGLNRGVWILAGVTARDWEDIAIGPGPVDSLDYLYIGEIGDNNGAYDAIRIYRVAEPAVSAGATGGTLDGVAVITCRYPDGPRDAEALFVDPTDGRIYIVTKREASVRLYRLPQSAEHGDTVTLEHLATLDSLTLITAGDISADGGEIVLKNYFEVYYWQRGEGESVAEALKREPQRLPYTIEPQGEAIAWGERGYYTVSEEFQGIPAAITLYRRLDMSVESAMPQNHPDPVPDLSEREETLPPIPSREGTFSAPR